jgi:hypothetical protein
MNDVIFRVNVPEGDGTVGVIELTPSMANVLYQAGLTEIQDGEAHVEGSGRGEGHDITAEDENGDLLLTIEWDSSLTKVTLGDSQLSPTEAAEVISLGFRRVLMKAVENVELKVADPS